jgi:pyruvate formate lyase activating enzyme
MIAGGFQKNSLIDFPKKIASVIFTKGCNFKCPYCHNPELISFEKDETVIKNEEIFSFLEKRRGFIDAVVITGGEPLLQKDITEFIRHIKELGYPVKIDTNGSRPEVLEYLISKNLVDLVAMDIKTVFENYSMISNEKDIKSKLENSVNTLMNSGIDHYFRTTCAPFFVSPQNADQVFSQIKGAKTLYLQKFKRKKVLDSAFFNDKKDLTDKDMEEIKTKAGKYVKNCIVF